MCRRVDATAVKVIIEQAVREGPCPECGVFSGTVKDRPVMRLKDLPTSGQTVELWCRKRRLICDEALCPRKTFTQVSAAIRPRARITERLRQQVARAIASGNRAVSEVAGRISGVLADRGQGAGRRGHEVVAGTGADSPAGD